ncbi:RIP metalloprotease RseP [Snodgrassella sp. CFCC 13594]|uniref:RIP metalloprotease RseP n=1 Tax=Snodgrassella sp. CFCC 13594 TaxID=1775559 RepID=UPI0008357C6F|nr:RIP metalloprotease RseP [Snodgrassella sp. CFCC 13594]
MTTLLAFVVAIVVLVSLHELGHFAVARLMGVKVLRFSVGFGTPFWKTQRGDTEWCLAPIPLGGYVKMVDTREGPVADADLPYAFDRQHPAKRIAIVLAGPLTNLLLAVVLYAVSFSVGGVTQVRPWVGMVTAPSIASEAGFQPGDRIESVNQQVVSDWADAQAAMVLNLDAAALKVQVRTADGQQVTRVIDVAGTDAADAVAKTGFLGMLPFKLTNRIGVVEPNGPAAKAGLQKGDALLAVDGKILPDWQAWVQVIQGSAGQKLTVTYERNGQQAQTQIRPDSVMSRGEITGRVGVGALPDRDWQAQVEHHYRPDFAAACTLAAQRVWHYISLTLRFFGKLLMGQASLANISGPLTIADVAGKTAAMGWQSYVEFLALVSVSLGVLNLLPIPVLDGGHLLYYAVEWLRGKPLSQTVQEWGLRFGLMAMLLLMMVAFFNDITRLFG